MHYFARLVYGTTPSNLCPMSVRIKGFAAGQMLFSLVAVSGILWKVLAKQQGTPCPSPRLGDLDAWQSFVQPVAVEIL